MDRTGNPGLASLCVLSQPSTDSLSELGALFIILIQRVTDMGLELTSKDHLISLYSKAGSHIPG